MNAPPADGPPAHRPLLRGRLARRPILRGGALPPALLLLALSSIFAFGGDRGQFYRPGERELAVAFMTVTANLSPEHRFLGFFRRELDGRDEPRYVPYNRFPIGSYALARLAILPFGDDFGRQLDAARLLMQACFAAAAAFAYLALARLLGDRRIALAATLLAFSSYYLLDYHDVASAEASTNLFGVMLVFHGMAVHAQEGRFRQLLVKTAIAILLGWHVVALIAPFVVLGLCGELWRARAGGAGLGALAGAAVRSRHLAYGAFAALCCALLLGWNLGNEYLSFDGARPLDDLPSFRSILRRTGSETASLGLGWGTILRGQLGAIGGLAIPFALVDRLGLDLPQPLYGRPWPPNPWFAPAGAAAFAVCLAGLRRLPCRTPVAALLLAGWCWAIPFRGSVATHEFEAMFHVGVPLVLWSLAFLGLRSALGRERAARALPAIALAAAAAFVLSAALAVRSGRDAEAASIHDDAAADLRAMRDFTADRSVLFDGIRRASTTLRWYASDLGHVQFHLAGSYLQTEPAGSAEDWARASRYDYIVLPVDFGGSLTPDNRLLHLYRVSDLPRIRASIAAREPALRARFDLRLEGRALTYVREACSEADADAPFFLDAVPASGGPPLRLDFAFRDRGVRFGGACLARIALPDEPLAGLRTGQRDEGRPVLWEASLPVEDASFPLAASSWLDRHADLAAREPALRSRFAVHLDGRTLHYAREDCAASDAEARFFLHVFPLDAGDLPEERRATGFDNLDFAFGERGVLGEGKCLASAPLPDYGVARVVTGQFEGDARLWEGEIAFPAPE